MFGATPILVLDMYEHAYHLEFGSDAAAYVDVFMRIIEWRVAAERLVQATGDGQRHEADAGQETLPSICVEELHTVMQSEQPFQVVDARPRNYVSRDAAGWPRGMGRAAPVLSATGCEVPATPDRLASIGSRSWQGARA